MHFYTFERGPCAEVGYMLADSGQVDASYVDIGIPTGWRADVAPSC